MLDVTISGAVQQPYFDLNRHTDADWTSGLRDKPAPYAVFVSDNLIVSQRSSESAALTSPVGLMTWWNDVVGEQDWLAGRLETRVGAELINVDVQNSAGAAHSGYPIQAYDKHWVNLADFDYLSTSGSWGDFHELGHNLQRGWWTFSNDVEVTVNIFSNYSKETMAAEPTTSGWGWSSDPVQVIQRATSDVSVGGTYSSKANRWSFWFQLADGFGWDAYRNVFRSYELESAGNPFLPSTDQEEKDEWFIRWSQEVGYGMTAFMVDTWGLNVTQAAKDAVAGLGLPSWMPVVGGVADAIVAPEGDHTFDIAVGALSMDDVADITQITAPANGTLVDGGDGSYAYTPHDGFLGADSFSYTLQSSAGNTATFVVNIDVTNHGVLEETWYGIGGAYLSDLRGDPDYPDNPDETRIAADLEARTNHADSYGTRIRTWLTAPQAGDYTFWIASDDYGELWLSDSADPAGASLIANVPGWTSSRQWDKFAEQQSAAVSLAAGQLYYIEALAKEGGGGDNLAVAWSGPGINGPEVIDSQYLTIWSPDVTDHESWQNPTHRFDVNGDREITAADILVLTTYINSNGPGALPIPATPPPFVDVDNDGNVTPTDLLQLITDINANGARKVDDAGGGSAAAEGEAAQRGLRVPQGQQQAIATTASVVGSTPPPAYTRATVELDYPTHSHSLQYRGEFLTPTRHVDRILRREARGRLPGRFDLNQSNGSEFSTSEFEEKLCLLAPDIAKAWYDATGRA